MRIAVIDLGTNTFHLLIAELSTSGFKVLYREKRAVKLGENGISNGVISIEAKHRAWKTLEQFSSLIQAYNVNKTKAVATSAFRNAKDGYSFAKELTKNIGIPIEILSGHEEASLIFMGVSLAVNLENKKALIVDIGGGSVEFIISINGENCWQRSYEIGGQRLMDKFHNTDPIPKENITFLKKYLDIKLESLYEAIHEFKPVHLVGSSGTFDTLAEIFHRETDPNFDIEKSIHTVLPYHAFFSIFETILHKSRPERLKIPGMLSMRADMIVVACILIERILLKLPQNPILISSFSLKEGVLKQELKSSFDFQNKSD